MTKDPVSIIGFPVEMIMSGLSMKRGLELLPFLEVNLESLTTVGSVWLLLVAGCEGG